MIVSVPVLRGNGETDVYVGDGSLQDLSRIGQRRHPVRLAVTLDEVKAWPRG